MSERENTKQSERGKDRRPRPTTKLLAGLTDRKGPDLETGYRVCQPVKLYEGPAETSTHSGSDSHSELGPSLFSEEREKMKTISRNRTNKIDQIFNAATRCVGYSLNNGFIGKEVSSQWVRQELDRFKFARLKSLEDGNFMVTVHGNLWYDIQTS